MTSTIKLPLRKILLDSDKDGQVLQDAVHRMHRINMAAYELLYHYALTWLNGTDDERDDGVMCQLMTRQSAVLQAFYAVSAEPEKGAPNRDKKLELCRETFDRVMVAHMEGHDPSSISRSKIIQPINAAARQWQVTTTNNLWMHYYNRLAKYVALVYLKDSSLDKRQKRLLSLRIAKSVCSLHTSVEYKDDIQVDVQQVEHTLHFPHQTLCQKFSKKLEDVTVKEMVQKHPHLFIRSFAAMNSAIETVCSETEGLKSVTYALFPLRRSLVPGHIELCQQAIQDLFSGGKKRKRLSAEEREEKQRKLEELQKKNKDQKRVRRSKLDPTLQAEQREVFERYFNVSTINKEAVKQKDNFKRPAKVQRALKWFDNSLTTDGVTACLRLRKKKHDVRDLQETTSLTNMPQRGMYVIDELKHLHRQGVDFDTCKIVGIDPGKVELISAASESAGSEAGQRKMYTFTNKRRRFETMVGAYNGRRSNLQQGDKIQPLLDSMCGNEKEPCNSRGVDHTMFKRYTTARREAFDVLCAHYQQDFYRTTRLDVHVRRQRSESRMVNELKKTFCEGDDRMPLLAYGAWGLSAGNPSCVNRGNPPCMGRGMLRKLAKEFPIVITPEAYTSKTCSVCRERTCLPCFRQTVGCGEDNVIYGQDGWSLNSSYDTPRRLQTSNLNEVRGLRLCTQCSKFRNRDGNAALNIAHVARTLLRGGRLEDAFQTSAKEDRITRLAAV